MRFSAPPVGSPLGVVGEALPVDEDTGLVTDDLHATGHDVAHMGRLAPVSAGDGLDVLGPLPSGQEGGTPDALLCAHQLPRGRPTTSSRPTVPGARAAL